MKMAHTEGTHAKNSTLKKLNYRKRNVKHKNTELHDTRHVYKYMHMYTVADHTVLIIDTEQNSNSRAVDLKPACVLQHTSIRNTHDKLFQFSSFYDIIVVGKQQVCGCTPGTSLSIATSAVSIMMPISLARTVTCVRVSYAYRMINMFPRQHARDHET